MGKKRLKKLIFFHGCFVASVNPWLRVERTLCRQSGVWVGSSSDHSVVLKSHSEMGGLLRNSHQNICPLKNSQKPHPWTLQTSERLCKKQTALSFFFFYSVSAMLSRCQGCDATLQKLLLAKHECAHYVQIALAHSNSLTAECWGLSEDVRKRRGKRQKIVPYSSTGCLGGQMAPGWKGARCSWLTMLGGCSLGIVSHLTLRAFKLMVRVNPCVFIHTGSIREEMYLSWLRCEWHWGDANEGSTGRFCHLLTQRFCAC